MTVNVTYREAGAVVPGATTIKNSPLSNGEIDGNFKSVKDAVEVLSTTSGAGLVGIVSPAGMSAVTVQGAIVELDSEKISSTVLAASDGSAGVGYDGGTVQDVLDGAKSLQDYADLRTYNGRATRIYITGLLVTKKPSGISGPFHHDQNDNTSLEDGGTVIVGADGRRWKRDFSGKVNIKWFEAVGDDIADDTQALLKARTYAINNAPVTMQVPKGTYRYTDIGNWGITGLTLEGDNDGGSFLKCTSIVPGNTALNMWAFESGSPTDQFIQQCNLRNIRVEGNANTTYIIRAYGLARCNWSNVTTANANPTSGVAFQFNACSVNQFSNLICSTDLGLMYSIPYYGIVMDTGYRAGVPLGASTNNTFITPLMEGVAEGINMISADQNTVIGGTSESCTVLGVKLSMYARYNTFIGHALEGNTAYDVLDSGYWNKFINCYSLGNFVLQGLNGHIDGGIYERVEVQAGATKNIVENIAISYVGGPSSGFIDNGDATEWKNIFDQQAGTYIYPLKPRSAISVGPSPFTYTNESRQYQEVIFQNGTLTSVIRVRDGVQFAAPTITPNSIWLAPLESLVVTYSAEPSMSYLPHNGFQG